MLVVTRKQYNEFLRDVFLRTHRHAHPDTDPTQEQLQRFAAEFDISALFNSQHTDAAANQRNQEKFVKFIKSLNDDEIRRLSFIIDSWEISSLYISLDPTKPANPEHLSFYEVEDSFSANSFFKAIRDKIKDTIENQMIQDLADPTAPLIHRPFTDDMQLTEDDKKSLTELVKEEATRIVHNPLVDEYKSFIDYYGYLSDPFNKSETKKFITLIDSADSETGIDTLSVNMAYQFKKDECQTRNRISARLQDLARRIQEDDGTIRTIVPPHSTLCNEVIARIDADASLSDLEKFAIINQIRSSINPNTATLSDIMITITEIIDEVKDPVKESKIISDVNFNKFFYQNILTTNAPIIPPAVAAEPTYVLVQEFNALAADRQNKAGLQGQLDLLANQEDNNPAVPLPLSTRIKAIVLQDAMKYITDADDAETIQRKLKEATRRYQDKLALALETSTANASTNHSAAKIGASLQKSTTNEKATGVVDELGSQIKSLSAYRRAASKAAVIEAKIKSEKRWLETLKSFKKKHGVGTADGPQLDALIRNQEDKIQRYVNQITPPLYDRDIQDTRLGAAPDSILHHKGSPKLEYHYAQDVLDERGLVVHKAGDLIVYDQDVRNPNAFDATGARVEDQPLYLFKKGEVASEKDVLEYLELHSTQERNLLPRLIDPINPLPAVVPPEAANDQRFNFATANGVDRTSPVIVIAKPAAPPIPPVTPEIRQKAKLGFFERVQVFLNIRTDDEISNWKLTKANEERNRILANQKTPEKPLTASVGYAANIRTR